MAHKQVFMELDETLTIQHDSALPVIWPITCSNMLIAAESFIQLDKATVFLKQGCATDGGEGIITDLSPKVRWYKL